MVAVVLVVLGGGDDGFVAFELPHVFLVTSVIKYVLPGRQRGTE